VNKGGTWAGAIEQLEKLHLVPVFVRASGKTSTALDTLVKRGAHPWSEPDTADGLNAALPALAPEGTSPPQPSQLTLAPARKTPRPVVRDSAAPDPSRASESDARADQAEPADELFQTVRSLVTRIASEPMTAAEIARNLAVTAPQVQKWLKRLVDEGVLEKSKKPVRYSLRQTGLFEPSSERPAVTRRRTGRGKR